MAMMSVVKALKPKKSWGQVSYTDRYLRGLLPQQVGERHVKTEKALYNGLNCERDTFTKNLRMHMKWYGEKKVKAYVYVQSFSPEDRRTRLTPELAHSLGMEFANRFFSDVPCLVVTHIDTDHLHNQFLVGNVNVRTGKCLRLNAGTLREMKLFTGRQCVRHGLSSSVFGSSRSRNDQKKSDAEHLMKRQGKVPVKDQLYEQIREGIESAEVNCFEDFLSYLSERYQIECRISGNTISFKHPALSRPVRGTRMSADLTKEGIELGISLAVRERMEAAGKEMPASGSLQGAYRNLLETASIWRQSRPEEYHMSEEISTDPVVTGPTPAVLSPSQMEECKHLLDDLIRERRRIRDKLTGLIDKLNGLKKDFINLCRNIAFWKKEKAQLEDQLNGELQEQAIIRPVSIGRSR